MSQLPLDSQAATPRCQGKTLKLRPCPWPAAPSGFCWRHDPEIGEEEKRRLARALGARGGAAKKANQVKRALAVSLETSAAIRAALEEALGEVRSSGADVCQRANVTARI